MARPRTFNRGRGRVLPCGWGDLARQFAIWFGFLCLYPVVRGFGGGDRTLALAHGAWVIHAEQRVGDLFELGVQRFAATSGSLEFAVSWTYWTSEFAVLGVALFWA